MNLFLNAVTYSFPKIQRVCLNQIARMYHLIHIFSVITVNGVPFIQAPSNIGLDDEDRESSVKYVYDVYWYDEDDQEKGDVLVDEEYREVRDDDYSSNDEQNPDNEYPASDSDNEYSAYADYDETHEMIREFESHRLRDSDSDEEWAALDD